MFSAIAVDDEAASLRRLERLLSAESRIDTFSIFDTPQEALNFAKNNEINLAFLDVEMPGMNGLALAEELIKLYPSIEIIFITAYNQYALDAFGLHASGYLLKPVSADDFNHELEIILKRHTPIISSKTGDKLVCSCFGPFSCRLKSSGELVRFRTAKAEELFIMLLDGHNCLRSKDYLLETLWPELDDLEKAGNNFRVTCSYLRKAFTDLGLSDVLLRSKEDYYLDLKQIECDMFTFRNAIDNYMTLPEEELQQIISLYKGAYLENKFYDWSFSSKNWFDKNCSKMLLRAYEMAMESQNLSRADTVLQRMLLVDPYDENAMELSMKLLIQQNSNQAARELYQNFKKKMIKDLGENPSDTLQDLYDSI